MRGYDGPRGRGGFLYYVSVAASRARRPSRRQISARLLPASARLCASLRRRFGIKTPEQAAEIARIADATVWVSAIVTRIEGALRQGKARGEIVEDTLNFCRGLADAVHEARGAREPCGIKPRHFNPDVLKPTMN